MKILKKRVQREENPGKQRVSGFISFVFHEFSTLELMALGGCHLNKTCTLPSMPGDFHIAPGDLCSLSVY